MVRHLAAHVEIIAHDPARAELAPVAGVRMADAATVARCDVVVLAVPVDQIETAITSIKPHLRPGAIVLDVGSVKIEPVRVMIEELPPFVEIIGTHPLFGPQSGRDGIRGLRIAWCPVRSPSARRLAAFLRRVLGLKVIVTTPDAHDREVAVVQGLTHLIAKVLVRMEPLPSAMTTASFDLIMRATDMVRHDSPAVYEAIERANPHAASVRARFFGLMDEVRQDLEDRSAALPVSTSAFSAAAY
jgi:prephenate dehydrogenase